MSGAVSGYARQRESGGCCSGKRIYFIRLGGDGAKGSEKPHFRRRQRRGAGGLRGECANERPLQPSKWRKLFPKKKGVKPERVYSCSGIRQAVGREKLRTPEGIQREVISRKKRISIKNKRYTESRGSKARKNAL